MDMDFEKVKSFADFSVGDFVKLAKDQFPVWEYPKGKQMFIISIFIYSGTPHFRLSFKKEGYVCDDIFCHIEDIEK